MEIKEAGNGPFKKVDLKTFETKLNFSLSSLSKEGEVER